MTLGYVLQNQYEMKNQARIFTLLKMIRRKENFEQAIKVFNNSSSAKKNKVLILEMKSSKSKVLHQYASDNPSTAWRDCLLKSFLPHLLGSPSNRREAHQRFQRHRKSLRVDVAKIYAFAGNQMKFAVEFLA